MRRFLLVIAVVVVLLSACADKKSVVSDKDTQIPDETADAVGVIDEEYILDDAIVIDDGDELLPDSPENEIPVDTDILYTLTINRPQEGEKVPAEGTTVDGTTDCFPSTISFTGDGVCDSPFGTEQGAKWYFSCRVSFTPGTERKLTVRAEGDGCMAEDSITVTAQPKEGVTSETRESNGTAYTIYRANIPTSKSHLEFTTVGANPFQTVQGYVESSTSEIYPLATVNGGTSSYWKGNGWHENYWPAEAPFVWESPLGNVGGPRACLVYDATGLRVELSMGRDPQSGDSLYPDAYNNVICGGPQLVKEGINVLTEQIAIENFETSVLLPDEELPRTAACVTNDGSFVIVAALADGVRFGMTLTALADYLIGIGCVDALNLAGDGATAFWSKDGGYHSGVEDPPVANVIALFWVGE